MVAPFNYGSAVRKARAARTFALLNDKIGGSLPKTLSTLPFVSHYRVRTK